MEARKAEWTALQLDIASKAIFEDLGLSFRVLDVDTHDAASHELPQVRKASGRIEGLHTVGGMDISFFKETADEAVATLTVMSFPDMVVSLAAYNLSCTEACGHELHQADWKPALHWHCSSSTLSLVTYT